MCDIIAGWPAPADEAGPHVDWVRELWRALDRVSTGSYVNHLGDDEIDAQRGYTSAQRTRLAALKARWTRRTCSGSTRTCHRRRPPDEHRAHVTRNSATRPTV